MVDFHVNVSSISECYGHDFAIGELIKLEYLFKTEFELAEELKPADSGYKL